MFTNYFEKLSEFKLTNVVEAQRRLATSAISFVPHEDTKDAIAKVVNLQLTFAGFIAEQFDKTAAQFRSTIAGAKS